ncbi:MAG: class I SAM-dependent methyltransferase [Cytophagales bacterium]|nr:class I SAM-dependent methyltransferase [Cytophagales bacterium]
MNIKKSIDLTDIKEAAAFYDSRYESGYMSDWDASKKERVQEIIRCMNLPTIGRLLDYGCGNGVFTEVLAHALPNWEIFGTDISTVALNNARKRYPAFHFATLDKLEKASFDLIFTHHVLEHVPDIKKSAEEISMMASKNCQMLHILPCGNSGSLEHRICLLRNDGINPTIGNRFFFEDESHLRRLTSFELIDLFAPFGFTYDKGFFANQYYGALDWISNYSEEFIHMLTDSSKAKSLQAARELQSIRNILLEIRQMKQKALDYRNNGIPYVHGLRSIGILLARVVNAYLANNAYERFLKKVRKEWEELSSTENGSEMYIILKR